MSDIIQLLPDSVANQIAAGEVIQRPASVIKELVENSIDAGAHTISVRVIDAGKTLIQVIDDGKGMSETDARLSFERHATSKIRNAADLFALQTMGFRGEALASIAAVAQVELKTRMATEDIGTRLCIAGCKVSEQEPISCPVGSNFSVENLFYNVPARRKFLKSNSTELNNIIAAFERIVLVNPHVNFTLYSNETEVMNLRAGGLRQRIIDVFGKKLNHVLLPLGVDTTVCKISGFVGKPEASRKKGAHQYFFVNSRFMKHPYFHKAVQNAYERLVPAGEQVPYFIYIDVPPEDIDVNIHPTKTEIKFENEQTIWQILMAAVKEAVGKFNDIPSIDFDTQGRPDIPIYNPEYTPQTHIPKVDSDPSYNPFNTVSTVGTSSSADDWETLFEGLHGTKKEEPHIFKDDVVIFNETDNPHVENGILPGREHDAAADRLKAFNLNIVEDKSPAHYQYKGKYIMTAVKSGLMIIDQHRAHLRILYDEYMQQIENRTGTSQKMLFPEVVQFPPSDIPVFEKVLPDMENIGFELTNLGGGSYAVNGIPAGLDGTNVTDLILNMVAVAVENGSDVSTDFNSTLALGLAHNAAIPYGQVLGNDEMENIVNSLFACENVNYSPDGKSIIGILEQSDIDSIMR